MYGVRFYEEPEFAHSNYWLNVLLLDQEFSYHLEPILELCGKSGLIAWPAWIILNKLKIFESCPLRETTCCRKFDKKGIKYS